MLPTLFDTKAERVSFNLEFVTNIGVFFHLKDDFLFSFVQFPLYFTKLAWKKLHLSKMGIAQTQHIIIAVHFGLMNFVKSPVMDLKTKNSLIKI